MVSAFKFLGAGIACTALSGVGIGIGIIFNGLLDGISRNPRMVDKLFTYALLGFALTEAIALFSLMICFLLMF